VASAKLPKMRTLICGGKGRKRNRRGGLFRKGKGKTRNIEEGPLGELPCSRGMNAWSGVVLAGAESFKQAKAIPQYKCMEGSCEGGHSMYRG